MSDDPTSPDHSPDLPGVNSDRQPKRGTSENRPDDYVPDDPRYLALCVDCGTAVAMDSSAARARIPRRARCPAGCDAQERGTWRPVVGTESSIRLLAGTGIDVIEVEL